MDYMEQPSGYLALCRIPELYDYYFYVGKLGAIISSCSKFSKCFRKFLSTFTITHARGVLSNYSAWTMQHTTLNNTVQSRFKIWVKNFRTYDVIIVSWCSGFICSANMIKM